MDPSPDLSGIEIASDDLKRYGYDKRELSALASAIEGLLTDSEISSGDLKGILNRAIGPGWRSLFPGSSRQILESW